MNVLLSVNCFAIHESKHVRDLRVAHLADDVENSVAGVNRREKFEFVLEPVLHKQLNITTSHWLILNGPREFIDVSYWQVQFDGLLPDQENPICGKD